MERIFSSDGHVDVDVRIRSIYIRRLVGKHRKRTIRKSLRGRWSIKHSKYNSIDLYIQIFDLCFIGTNYTNSTPPFSSDRLYQHVHSKVSYLWTVLFKGPTNRR